MKRQSVIDRLARVAGPILAVLVSLPGCGSGFNLGGTSAVDAYLGGDASARASTGAFKGMGMGFFGDPLNLSSDQQAQAKDIFQRMHDDIEGLRQQAEADVRNVLTAEQQAKFDELKAQRPAPPEGGFGPMGGPGGPGGPGAGFGGPPPFARGPGGPDAGHPNFIDQLAEDLGLTDDQKAQITTIHDNLHTAIEARRQQAIDELKAILNADQLATLAELESHRPM